MVEGAVADTTTSCLPKSHREALYTVAALHQWPVNVPQEDVRCVLTARDWIDKVIHVESPGGPLPCVSVCFLQHNQRADGEAHQFLSSSHPDAIRGVYGENFERLLGIKQHFDPDNFFRHSLWPAAGHRGNLLATVEDREKDYKVSEDIKKIWKEEDQPIGRDGVLGISVKGCSI